MLAVDRAELDAQLRAAPRRNVERRGLLEHARCRAVVRGVDVDVAHRLERRQVLVVEIDRTLELIERRTAVAELALVQLAHAVQQRDLLFRLLDQP